MEPWHVSYITTWTQDKMTRHDECLARIHIMEHELGMNPEHNDYCELCVSKEIDRLWTKVTLPSRYDPGIEGRLWL